MKSQSQFEKLQPLKNENISNEGTQITIHKNQGLTTSLSTLEIQQSNGLFQKQNLYNSSSVDTLDQLPVNNDPNQASLFLNYQNTTLDESIQISADNPNKNTDQGLIIIDDSNIKNALLNSLGPSQSILELSKRISNRKNSVKKIDHKISTYQKAEKVLTEEEMRNIEKKKRQEQHLQELELLASENCPKIHPFDFRFFELAEIKKEFPEFQPKPVATADKPIRLTRSNKILGMPIQKLKNLFEKIMIHDSQFERTKEDLKLINELMEKLDHKNQSTITWQEFLKFLDYEGMRRDMVDDAQLYGMGVKRINQVQRINLKETPNQIEYYIDNCLYMSYGKSFKFLLALFENNQAKIFDTRTYKVIQELNYPSNYAQPKQDRKIQSQSIANNSKEQMKDQNTQDKSINLVRGSSFQINANRQINSQQSQRSSLNLQGIDSQKDSKIGKQGGLGTQDMSPKSISVVGTIATPKNAIPQNTKLIGLKNEFRNMKNEKQGKIDKNQRLISNLSKVDINSQGDQTSKINKINEVSVFDQKQQQNENKMRKLLGSQSTGQMMIKKNLNMNQKYQTNQMDDSNFSSLVNKFDDQNPYLNTEVSATILEENTLKQKIISKTQLKNNKIQRGQSAAANHINNNQKQSQDLEIIREENSTVNKKRQMNFYRKDPYKAQINQNQKKSYNLNIFDKQDSQSPQKNESPSIISLKQNKINKNQNFMIRRGVSQAKKKNQLNQKRSYAILGLDSLVDQEGTQAYYAGKDLEKDDNGFGVRYLMPNLYQDYGKYKKKWEKRVEAFDKKVDQFEKKHYLTKQQTISSTFLAAQEKTSKLDDRKSRESSARNQKSLGALGLMNQENNQFDSFNRQQNNLIQSKSLTNQTMIKKQNYNLNEEEQKMRDQTYQILGQKRVVDERIKNTKQKMSVQNNKLAALKETNKYFFTLTSPSPYMIAQQQYLKRQLQNKGVDTDNPLEVAKSINQMGIQSDQKLIRNITGSVPDNSDSNQNFCTPDMIAKYVEKLKKNEKKDSNYISKQKKNASQFDFTTSVTHAKKLKQMSTKSVYALCATYNEELGYLALSLIDREIKVYRIKQNGSKVIFVDHISFQAKYYVTCLCIERCVANSREIICLGSKSGDIQIYYLDEPFHDPITKKPTLDGRFREKQHDCSPFNFFKLKHNNQKIFENMVEKNSNRPQTNNLNDGRASQISVKSRLSGQINLDRQITMNNQPDQFIPEEEIEEDRDDIQVFDVDKKQKGDSIEYEQKERVKSNYSKNQDQNQYNKNYLKNKQNQNIDESDLNVDVVQAKWPGIDNRLPSQPWEAIKFDFFDFQQPEKFKQEQEKNKNPENLHTQQSNNINKTREKMENELTKIRYVRDIGLICSSFNGTLKFFDPFDFNEQWCTSNALRQESEHTNITVFDISVKLALMATGGAEGRLILIDPYAQGIIKKVDAHNCEILQLYIFDEQQQIITVALDRSIGLWDARLEKIQIIKDINEPIHAPRFSSSTFDYKNGFLFIGCQQINVWQAQVDQKVEINALQVKTLSKNILEQRKMLETQDPNYDPNKQDLHSYKTADPDQKSGKVLVTSASTLVEIVINNSDAFQFILTIDSENLLRVWDIKNSITVLSYRIPIVARVTAVAVDDSNKYLAVGSSIGEAKILNIKSGGILYNLTCSQQEVSFLKFTEGQTEFWLFGAQWGGNLMMWTRPSDDNNFTITHKCKKANSTDIIALDCSQTLLVAGDDSGEVSIWNVSSGQVKYRILMPSPKDNEKIENKNKKKNSEKLNYKSDDSSESSKSLSGRNTIHPLIQENKNVGLKRSVVGLNFHPVYQNHVCIMQETGYIHLIDATNGAISHYNLAMAKTNSSWACDKFKLRMMIIGDTGKASLFDISMGSKESNLRDFDNEGDIDPYNSKNKKQKGGILKYSTPAKDWKNHMGQQKWPFVVKWFEAHTIKKMDPSYVVTIKFVEVSRIYVTGTTAGEVKLWDSNDCSCLGILNSQDWNPKAIIRQLNKSQAKLISSNSQFNLYSSASIDKQQSGKLDFYGKFQKKKTLINKNDDFKSIAQLKSQIYEDSNEEEDDDDLDDIKNVSLMRIQDEYNYKSNNKAITFKKK